MTVQNFKGDAIELKMQSVASPVFDQTSASLDDFYAGGFNCDEFLLMLYDDNRMPFSERVNRVTFVQFIKKALENFPFTGTFEAYLFVLRSIFGDLSEIDFDVPSPGKLAISVNAVSSLEFDFIAREFIAGTYEFFDVVDYAGNILTFRGIAGIDTEYELNLLFSEIIPAGITPDIALTFYTNSFWVSEESSVFYDMTDDAGNNIVFREIGG